MEKIKQYLLLLLLLIGSAGLHAASLQGKVYVLSGNDAIAPPYDIDGTIDFESNYMSVSDWGPFFGVIIPTNSIELLEPGTHTREAGTVTVQDGQIGAHVETEFNGSGFTAFMVWNVSGGGTVFTIADSDNDGFPGHTMVNGPFIGITLYFEFEITGQSDEQIKLLLDTGGQLHECIDGVAEVPLTVTPQLFGGAVLEALNWSLNGEPLGSELSQTQILGLGNYVLTATALTTSGLSDTASASFSVKDTRRPVVKVAFLDIHDNEVTSAYKGKFTISIDVTDDCDQAPVITSSTATPTTTVSDGDTFLLNQRQGIKLPVTAVRVSASARDASGNTSITTSESSKTLTLE